MAKSSIYDSKVSADTTSFRFEREMVNPMISFLPLIFQPLEGERTLLLREQAVGPVIPDLMRRIFANNS